MLNKDLIGTEKDQEIARLNLIIEKYKEYDAKRMEYVRDLEAKYSIRVNNMGKHL